MARVATLRRLLPTLRPYRGRLAVGLLTVVVASALGSVIPWLLRSAVDGLRAGAPPARLWAIAGAMLGTALVSGAFRFWMREIMNGISRRVETDLRDELFAHLLTLDAGTVGRWRTGELMARLTNDLSAVRMAAGPAIMYLVNTIAGGAFALAFMLRIDARLTGLALLPMVLLPFVMVKLGRLVHDRFEAVQEHFGALTTRVQENLSGTRIVRAYRQEAPELARFTAANDEYARRNVALAHLNGVMNPAFGLLAGIGAVVVLGLGGTLALRGTISVGAFVAFGLYLAMLTWPLIALGWVTNLFQRGAASMGRIAEVLDARPAVTTPTAPRPLPALAAGTTGRTLEFRGVGFHFPTPPAADAPAATGTTTTAPAEPRWVLRDVSFTLPAGATLGIVGAVGSGKTALVELVPRLHDPQEGEILLDGVPLRALDLAALRREIGYVPQESLLFSETLGSNIAYGLDGAPLDGGEWAVNAGAANAWDANGREPNSSESKEGATDRSSTARRADRAVDDMLPPEPPLAPPGDGLADARREGAVARLAEATAGTGEPTERDVVAWAADVAALTSTVAAFPAGFGTVLGERGVNLSGGQKQRAAIARALARRPAVVLLDDALSAVDGHTEAAILRALRTALAGRTAIITSHRISAVREAALILVLDGGRVVERGTHAELLAAGGRYAALARRQQLEEAVAQAEEAADATGSDVDAPATPDPALAG